jgi:hypothetical protein
LVRYVVKWDAPRKGYGIFDSLQGVWTAQPVFGLEHVAWGIAESLDEQETARQHRRVLSGEIETGSSRLAHLP